MSSPAYRFERDNYLSGVVWPKEKKEKKMGTLTVRTEVWIDDELVSSNQTTNVYDDDEEE